MATKAQQLQEQIIEAIAKAADPTIKAVLLLMHQQTILIAESIQEVNDKLDAVWSDEKSLRESVLNGHAANHDIDHEWVSARRNEKCEEVCSWARGKLDVEQEDEKAKRKFVWGVRENVIAALITALALTWLPRVFGG